jgi:PAS domain S-box-containing protein
MLSPAARISLIYLIVGSLWIAFSDYAVGLLFPQASTGYLSPQTFKGWFFIIATATLLFLLMQREFRKRQESEQRLRQQETEVRELFANNPLPMWVYETSSLAFIDVNDAACKHYGYSREEFLRMKITDIRPPEDILKLQEYLQKQTSGFRFSGEWRHRAKDGQIIEVESSAHTIEYLGKQAVLVVACDITERKRTNADQIENERLRVRLSKEFEMRDMRSHFISMVSHEFRRPLTNIASSVELIENYGDRMTKEAEQKHFSRIHEQIDEMKELLDDFLALMRAETTEQGFQSSPIDLAEICGKLVEELRLSVSSKHTITYTNPCSSIVFPGDEKVMRRAIGNLLSNAVKYSSEGGEVSLLVAHDTTLTLHIIDQGIGIPASEQEKIFSPFFRASNVSEIGGTGLGLSIAKQGIELHGGTLEIARSDKTGTDFLVTLPINESVILTGC